jgi:cyclic pyranopterin phosphate synthase
MSVTDRCNYHCVYCRTAARAGIGSSPSLPPASADSAFPADMMKSHHGSGGPAELPVADCLHIARVFASLGIGKIRLTGGEPLLRRELVEIVAGLAKLRGENGQAVDLAITTNGHLLGRLAQPLADAGLRRVTVSMDAVEPRAFARLTRVEHGLAEVVTGIRAALRAGLSPVKVNCVLLRGFNDDQIVPMGKFARDEGVVVRFIEFMPLDEGKGWAPELVIKLDEVLQRMSAFMPLRELAPRQRHASASTENYASPEDNGTARRYVFADGRGEIGIIAPFSRPYCDTCSRVRVTHDGKIRTCLFSTAEHDLYGALKNGASDEALAEFIVNAMQQKEERGLCSETGFRTASRTMMHIGG